eukprot:scaffold7.g3560.t1
MAARKASTSPFLRAGVPILVLTVGGFLWLKTFVKGRHDVMDAQQKELDLRAPVEKQRAKKFSLDEELKRLKEHMDLNAYENKPVPRPKDD